MQQYPAESLSDERKEFRLLTLLPGEGSADIKCTLRSASCVGPDVERYEALSYEWGESGHSRAILVNGQEFSVGENLFQALCHLRVADVERALWIDAICINQSDVRERNHQVQQMARIYRQAHQVVSWIGLETEDSKKAFEFLRAAFEFSPHNRRSLMEDAGWWAVVQLCERPYWRRVWIVQEICLAQRLVIQCGPDQIPWRFISELRRARSHIWPQYLSQGERDFMRSVPASIDHHRELRQKGGCVLWALLETFQTSLCREVHDRVYGFLGMANDCDEDQGIVIDYSCSIGELCEDVMRFYHDKFRAQVGSEEPPHGAQLVKLSEFLQQLFWADLKHMAPYSFRLFRHEFETKAAMDISATSVMVVEQFLDTESGKQYGASDLVRVLEREWFVPELGHLCRLISPGAPEVYGVNNALAEVFCHVAIGRRIIHEDSQDEARTKRVFLARPPRLTSSFPASRRAVGVAPEGTRLGDLVCTFLESQLALVVRPIMDRNQSFVEDPEEGLTILYGGGVSIIGRAVLDMSSEESRQSYRAQLNPDKTVEVQPKYVTPETAPWPATVSLPLSTLRLVTKPPFAPSPVLRNSAKPMLDLFPREGQRAGTENRNTR